MQAHSAGMYVIRDTIAKALKEVMATDWLPFTIKVKKQCHSKPDSKPKMNTCWENPRFLKFRNMETALKWIGWKDRKPVFCRSARKPSVGAGIFERPCCFEHVLLFGRIFVLCHPWREPIWFIRSTRRPKPSI